jgi:uncharacterized protein YdgA (DUF945 family)
MKKIVVVVVVLAAILLAAPFGVGKLAEKRVNAGLDKLVKEAPYFTIVSRKWTGGWFKSHQELVVELSPVFSEDMDTKAFEKAFSDESAEAEAAMSAEGTEPGAMPDASEAAEGSAGEAPPMDMPSKKEPVRFTVRNEVLHGPVLGLSGFGLARVDSKLDLPEDVVAKIREAFGPKPALEVSTRVGFFGGGTTTFTSEGRTVTPKNGKGTITYDTFKLAVGFGKNGDSYDFDGKWPKFEVKEEAGTVFTMSDMTIDGDMKRVMGDLYDGDFAFKIDDINVPDKSVSVKDAHYIVETRTKDGFVDMWAKLGTGAIKSPQFAMTGIEVKGIHYDFSFRHLHAESMDKLSQGMREAYAKATLTADSDAFEEALLGALKTHGGELLKHDPELGIDRVGLETPDGEGVIKGVVKFVGVTPEDFSVPGGMGLIGKLDADVTVSLDNKLVEKMPGAGQGVEGAIAAGYAKRDGDKIVCHITFKGGELLINGKPQAIPGLGGPPGGMPEE